ncbi:hypothetical protein [Candidatus Odyssella acanthamoebae]|uniref:hypothetical protein n=1 Tax=Candidatus Odyssella acanthamoebae TaxID=91604 RepID=UPI0018DC6A86|nr:hypothetical protein [Candidatus Paracaedibacter acanthamoebae]
MYRLGPFATFLVLPFVFGVQRAADHLERLFVAVVEERGPFERLWVEGQLGSVPLEVLVEVPTALELVEQLPQRVGWGDYSGQQAENSPLFPEPLFALHQQKNYSYRCLVVVVFRDYRVAEEVGEQSLPLVFYFLHGPFLHVQLLTVFFLIVHTLLSYQIQS